MHWNCQSYHHHVILHHFKTLRSHPPYLRACVLRVDLRYKNAITLYYWYYVLQFSVILFSEFCWGTSTFVSKICLIRWYWLSIMLFLNKERETRYHKKVNNIYLSYSQWRPCVIGTYCVSSGFDVFSQISPSQIKGPDHHIVVRSE